MNKLKFFPILVLILVLWLRVDTKAQSYFGVNYGIGNKYHHYVYLDDLKWGREEPDTEFTEKNYQISLLFEDALELNLSIDFRKVKNAFIAGGIWNFDKTVFEFSAGKIVTANLQIPFPFIFKIYIDFYGGFFAGLHLNRNFEFIRENEDRKVEKKLRLGSGLYTGIRLRFRIKGTLMGAIGYKWYFPCNNFQYNPEDSVAYRLQRKILYFGFYFDLGEY
jgi:hypothetical protein